ncbi:MAG TPA: pilus assembly protein TadG-related protein [Dehalococcoidia bacterium]|nr:pilus assembly protein TadG-related protein [Dehalococcoidia bacterium]
MVNQTRQDTTADAKGQTLIIFALMLSVLMLCVGLVTDVGMAVVADQRTQNASDAAALAASDVLLGGGSVDDAEEAAFAIAAENGYVDGDEGITVTVNIPPESGPFAGQSNHAEVVITDQSHNYFFSIIGNTFIDVHSRAVSRTELGGGNYGIIALNPHDCRSFEIDGTAQIHISGGGIFVNSDCPTDAMYGEGVVTVDTAVNTVVGGWDTSGSANFSPTPTGGSQITDPLANLPVPTPPTNVQTCPDFSGSPGTTTLLPGRYNCAINPSGPWNVVFQPGDYHITGGVVADGGGNITFNAGVYTLGGVGITVTGSGRITVNNAMLYIESGEVELTGNGITSITAPETGVYAGIAIFQNRSSTTQVDMNGTALAGGWGTVYAAGAKVSIVGTSASSNMQFISDTFIMSGIPDLDLIFDSDITVGQQSPKLVE